MQDKNEAIVNKTEENIRNNMTPDAFEAFRDANLRAEAIKTKAEAIDRNNTLDKKTKDAKLKELLKQFNKEKVGINFFKDSKTLVVNGHCCLIALKKKILIN